MTSSSPSVGDEPAVSSDNSTPTTSPISIPYVSLARERPSSSEENASAQEQLQGKVLILPMASHFLGASASTDNGQESSYQSGTSLLILDSSSHQINHQAEELKMPKVLRHCIDCCKEDSEREESTSKSTENPHSATSKSASPLGSDHSITRPRFHLSNCCTLHEYLAQVKAHTHSLSNSPSQLSLRSIIYTLSDRDVFQWEIDILKQIADLLSPQVEEEAPTDTLIRQPPKEVSIYCLRFSSCDASRMQYVKIPTLQTRRVRPKRFHSSSPNTFVTSRKSSMRTHAPPAPLLMWKTSVNLFDFWHHFFLEEIWHGEMEKMEKEFNRSSSSSSHEAPSNDPVLQMEVASKSEVHVLRSIFSSSLLNVDTVANPKYCIRMDFSKTITHPELSLYLRDLVFLSSYSARNFSTVPFWCTSIQLQNLSSSICSSALVKQYIYRLICTSLRNFDSMSLELNEMRPALHVLIKRIRLLLLLCHGNSPTETGASGIFWASSDFMNNFTQVEDTLTLLINRIQDSRGRMLFQHGASNLEIQSHVALHLIQFVRELESGIVQSLEESMVESQTSSENSLRMRGRIFNIFERSLISKDFVRFYDVCSQKGMTLMGALNTYDEYLSNQSMNEAQQIMQQHLEDQKRFQTTLNNDRNKQERMLKARLNAHAESISRKNTKCDDETNPSQCSDEELLARESLFRTRDESVRQVTATAPKTPRLHMPPRIRNRDTARKDTNSEATTQRSTSHSGNSVSGQSSNHFISITAALLVTLIGGGIYWYSRRRL